VLPEFKNAFQNETSSLIIKARRKMLGISGDGRENNIKM
jgi:hypothetical protein